MYWSFQVIFKSMLVFSACVAFSLQSSVSLWVSLELNFLCFIGVLGKSVKLNSSNSVIYYFLIQSLGSVMMLVSLLMVIMGHSKLFELLFISALILKLGGAPFQFWYLKIIQKLVWGMIWVLSIWQKVIPLILLSLSNLPFLLLTFGGLSVTLGSIGSVKQKNVKKILGLSSIFSLGWVMVSTSENSFVWTKFMFGYGLALLGLVMVAHSAYLFKTKDVSYSLEPLFLLMFFLSLLMLSGIPPFIGFFLKVMILKFLIFKKFIISLFLLMMSLGLIFVYLMVSFYLLTSTMIFTTIKSSGTPQLYVMVDLLMFNILVSVILLNTMFCKYYVSNEMELQSPK